MQTRRNRCFLSAIECFRSNMTNGKKCEKYVFKIDRLRALQSLFFCVHFPILCERKIYKRHGHFFSFLYVTPCISCLPHCARCSKAQPQEFIIKILEKSHSVCVLVNARNNNNFNGQFTLLQSKACHWYGPISRMWLIAVSQPISEKMMLQLDDFCPWSEWQHGLFFFFFFYSLMRGAKIAESDNFCSLLSCAKH